MAKNSQQCVVAIREGNEDQVKSFLSDSVDACAEVYTWCLLIHAIREGHISIIKLLLDAGATWKGKDGYSRNALEVACQISIQLRK